jgi:hypothetical protein
MMQLKKDVPRFAACVAVLCMFLFPAIPAFPQLPTATILGVVKDATGGVVVGAAVTVTNTDTSLTRTGSTESDGSYRFPALPVGNYQVQVMKAGFETFLRKGITLVVAQDAPIDVTLQVGSTGQTVVVTEQAPLVNTTSSTLAGLLDEQSVADLPLNGRNLVDLTLLQPGVLQSNVFAVGQQGSSNITGTLFSSNGSPIHSNNYLLDGAIQTGAMSMSNASIIGTTLGVDGVKEYKVISSLPDAEYGMVMGSTSTTVSKSGTNSFHGDAYEYLRNSALDARNYFDALDTVNFYGFGASKSAVFPGKRIPPFQRNNFGGALGGPIKKDKTFFFAVYEGLRANAGQTITTTTLSGACFDPTTHIVTAASFGSAGCSGVAPASQNPVVMHFFEDPIFPGTNYVNGLFPYPNANINPATGATLPNATFNFTFPFVEPQSEDYGQMRVDQNFSSSDNLFARFTEDKAGLTGNIAYPLVRSFQSSTNSFTTLAETHIFSPTVLNTIRFSFSRTFSHIFDTLVPFPTDPNVLIVAIPPGGPGNYGNFTVGGVDGFEASGGGLGDFLQNIYSYSDDVFWTKGKHSFKFGALLNNFQTSENVVFNNGGSISFSNLANAALGVFSGSTVLRGTQYPLEARYYLDSTFGVYAQDDFRATPRLTLNLGLRYEFATVPREANGNNWNIQNLLTANGKNSTLGAVPSRLFQNMSLHDFSPRIGFAYDVTGKGTMSIRGGAGIYYDIGNYGSEYLQQACCQPPVNYFVTITNVSSTTVPFPLSIPFPTSIGSGHENDLAVAAAIGLPSPRNMDYHMHQPEMLHYNLTIDRQLPWNMAVTASFAGSRGWHLDITREANPLQPLGTLPNGLPYFCDVAVHPTTTNDPLCANSTATTGTPAVPVNPSEFLVRPNQTYGPITQETARSDSWYNALQVNLTKRTTHGLEFGSAFTWSKLLDDGQAQQPGEGNSIRTQDVFNNYLDKGRSGFDLAYNSETTATYHAPSFKSDKMYMKPLNGWWFGGILTIKGGYPFNPTLGGNRSFSQTGTYRPDLAPNFNIGTVYKHSVTQWFDPTMFSVPMDGTFGNAPRDGLRGPNLRNVNININKDTKARFLGEQGAIQFRWEIFNLLNRPNFALPNSTVWNIPKGQQLGSNPCGGQIGATTPCTVNGLGTITQTFPAFGQAGNITSTVANSRQMQFALKVLF